MKVNLFQLFGSAKAVLFDLDGVVIDSDGFHDEAKKVTLQHFGFSISHDDWEKIKHHSITQIYEWLLVRDPKIQVTALDFVDYKRDYFSRYASGKINLVKDVLTFAKSLKEQGIKLALVTATSRRAFDFFYDKFELEKYFSVVVTGEDVKNLKPHPEGYLLAVGLLDLDPQNCVVIEDTVVGVQSGKLSGCRVVARSVSVSTEVLLLAGADAVFKDFFELIDLPH